MFDPRRIFSSAQLPTLPVAAQQLIELSRRPDCEIADVLKAIKSDPAIAARILRAANSSFFGLASKVESVDRAVLLLGTTAVTALALGFSLVESSAAPGPLGEAYASFWLQSAVQAAAAEALAQNVKIAGSDVPFLAGLLLDLGRLAILKTASEEYLPVVAAAATQQRCVSEVEHDVLGISHAEVGGELARRWNLPERLCAAIRMHHETVDALEAAPADQRALCRLAATASAVGEYFCGADQGHSLGRLRQLAEACFEMTSEQLDALLDGLRGRVDEIAALFSIGTQALARPAELLVRANEQLAILAMSAQAESTQARARQEAIEDENRALVRQNDNLRRQALRDPLTHTYNRAYFDDALSREVARCARSAHPVGLVFIDVDRFKQLNDEYGHACGDDVLRQIADRLTHSLRGGDVLARYGGEEFVLLVHQPTERGLDRIAQRIRECIAEAEFTSGEQRLKVTVSVGAAISIPARDDTSAGSVLVQAADQAMYEAKLAGRNGVRSRCLMSSFERHLSQLAVQRRFSRWLVQRGVLDRPSVSRALLRSRNDQLTVGDLARQTGMLDADEIAAVSAAQERIGTRFGETAARLGLLSLPQLGTLLALQQENPRDVAVNLARMGLVDAREVQSLLNEYERDIGIERELQPA